MDRDNGLRTPAQWAFMAFGIVYLLVGILGFVGEPLVTADPDGMSLLLGLFAVDTVHNVVHLLTGVIAMALAMRVDPARNGARVFGVVYLGLALWGFSLVGATGERTDMLAGLVHVNAADNWLHTGTALFNLVLGFTAIGWTARELPLAGEGRYTAGR